MEAKKEELRQRLQNLKQWTSQHPVRNYHEHMTKDEYYELWSKTVDLCCELTIGIGYSWSIENEDRPFYCLTDITTNGECLAITDITEPVSETSEFYKALDDLEEVIDGSIDKNDRGETIYFCKIDGVWYAEYEISEINIPTEYDSEGKIIEKCPNLKTIFLPRGIQKINCTFEQFPNLERIYIDTVGNDDIDGNYYDLDGIVYDKRTDKPVIIPRGRNK